MASTIVEMPSVALAARLNVSQLRRRCDPGQFPFTTTAEVPDGPLVFGQDTRRRGLVGNPEVSTSELRSQTVRTGDGRLADSSRRGT